MQVVQRLWSCLLLRMRRSDLIYDSILKAHVTFSVSCRWILFIFRILLCHLWVWRIIYDSSQTIFIEGIEKNFSKTRRPLLMLLYSLIEFLKRHHASLIVINNIFPFCRGLPIEHSAGVAGIFELWRIHVLCLISCTFLFSSCIHEISWLENHWFLALTCGRVCIFITNIPWRSIIGIVSLIFIVALCNWSKCSGLSIGRVLYAGVDLWF